MKGLFARRARASVGWFVPMNHSNFDKLPASVWIRCLQLLPYLKELGFESTVNDLNARTDVAVFVRWQNDAAHERALSLKKQGTPIVFDLCVNYFDEAVALGVGAAVTRRHIEDCLRMVALADVVTTASCYIAERARQHHGRVVYIPDSIDPSHFQYSKRGRDFDRRPLRAVWCGVAPKAIELEPLLPLLSSSGIDLTVIADRPPDLTLRTESGEQTFAYTYRRWAYRTFPRDLLEGEICLSHRRLDNEYNQGHSHFKIGVFLAAGVPALASQVPSYCEILDRHECGAVCRSFEEWQAALELILKDRSVLKQWGQCAKAAMEPYATPRVAAQYAEIFESLR